MSARPPEMIGRRSVCGFQWLSALSVWAQLYGRGSEMNAERDRQASRSGTTREHNWHGNCNIAPRYDSRQF